MLRVKTRGKNTYRIPGKLDRRVVELALQNPDLGARRLAPLLKKEKITVSPSKIYGILKRHNLSTCAKRRAKLKEQARKRKFSIKRVMPKITGDSAARIVALSLQHPDYGAKRLVPLLEADGIRVTSSAVYRILRYHGLQNRFLRQLKLKEQQAAEASRNEAAAVVPLPEAPAALPLETAEEIEPLTEEPQPLLPVVEDEALIPRAMSVSKRPAKIRAQGAGIVTLFNIVLLALLAYLGFYTVQNLRRAGTEPQAEPVAAVPAVGAVEELQSDALSLAGYRTIWERNLFNISGEEAPAQPKEAAVEKLALAEKDLGLTLVGTVAAENAHLRRAFIDDSKTRKQKAFREGDMVGAVRIKKILRNRVVVATREGDRVLTSDILETGRQQASSLPIQQLAESTSVQERSAEDSVDLQLKHSEVESSLADLDKLMEEVRIDPYLEDDQPAGFMLGGIMGWNILAEMGLRNGDVITGVNGESFTSPEQAVEFFERLSQGGQVTIDINRRRRPLKVRLNIG